MWEIANQRNEFVIIVRKFVTEIKKSDFPIKEADLFDEVVAKLEEIEATIRHYYRSDFGGSSEEEEQEEVGIETESNLT